MPLLQLRDLSFTHGGPLLLDRVNLSIDRGERVGLVGRNGMGKSTLLGLLDGTHTPDDGEVLRESGVRIARLVQEVPQGTEGRVSQIVSGDDQADGGDIDPANTADPAEIDWKREQAVEKVLSRMDLDGEAIFARLSSGMKRRVLLARALVDEPDVLLLDEPTNHLDIESIAWLERFLKGYNGAIVFVTHDRVFLQALATRIVEVERARLFDWTCDYATFLKRKEAALDAEEQQNKLFDKKLAEEEKWIRQGIKARRTRNEGRVRALKQMREERAQRRDKMGNVRMGLAAAERSGQLVVETESLRYEIGGRTILQDVELLITRGDRVGIIGPNGAGKTTLLKLMLGGLEPTGGTVRRGTHLEIAYFDQLRETLDEDDSVVNNVGEGADQIEVKGQSRHVYGYLQDFLFTPDRARQPVRMLSGGERNRLLLAKLFKKPANLLVLDEPTNDLDAETLELLEELLSQFGGTLLVVSHDRAFLNNVVTQILAVEGDGFVKEYAGGYDDYAVQKQAATKSELELSEDSPSKSKSGNSGSTNGKKPKKLSFKERSLLDQLPRTIEELEAEQAELQSDMSQPEFYQQPSDQITAVSDRLEEISAKLLKLYEQWEALESRA
ncbi:ATP-binding cassette domain-containing protein [Stratiformator vulcanicus]|uniref:ATP-binding protein Uup n=1 Tax=Stratiformator vulcanicus TaxID=2527980 RepID=A0A517R7J4_9PLAN|nr:ATP-binding cassette domain-containing protein [Stratiformator vulcanicus]QDT39845.1 ABC transporter ATP-binding protein uup [Stratiformator vulcanicus]